MTVLTIVMPSYNQGEFIEDAVNSVLENLPEREEVEFIIKDNCSDDKTHDYLNRLLHDKRVTIDVIPDKGQSDALQSAFATAKGEILCWLNSDDVLIKDSLTTVITYFKKNKETDIVYGKALFMDKKGEITNIYPTGPFNTSLLLNTCYLSQPSVFFRRSIYKQINGINPQLKYCLDYDLWVRFSLVDARFAYLPQYLSATRQYEETKTATGGAEFVDEITDMLEKNVNYLPTAWVLYKEYEQLKNNSNSSKYWLYFKAWCHFLIKHKGTKQEALDVLKHHLSQRVFNKCKVLTIRGTHFSQLLIKNKV